MKPQPIDRKGLLFGLACYGFWGFMPLYFVAVNAASLPEIVAYRIVLTMVFSLVGLLLVGQWGIFRQVLKNRRQAITLAIAGVFLATNWTIYVWAVTNDRVIDASLGYFVNPLVTVLLAIIVLKERPRKLQLAALGFGSSAVVLVAVWYGQIPWVSLLLALTFGVYSLIKKRLAEVTPMVGLTMETVGLVPFGLAYLVWLQSTGAGTLSSVSTFHSVALLLAGVITAVPLLFFAAATRRIPLTYVGLLQYVCPVMQFLLGVIFFREEMSLARWIGFGLIWVALLVLAYDMIHNERKLYTVQVSEPAM